MQELYHELHALDRFELDYQRKRLEEEISLSNQRGNQWVLLLIVNTSLAVLVL